MSVGAILTLGLGSFGSVNLLPTLGYGASTAVSGHSPYYSEFSEYSIEGLEQRFPWGKRKRANKRDEQDIEDILSALPWDKL